MNARLQFLGAAGNVTGSCYLLEHSGSSLLVDCGLFQERKYRDRNWKPFPCSPATIGAVLLTHAHLDHCGLLPKLVREGFNGPIYCTPATAEIARIVLLDSARIQEEDTEFKRRRHRKEGRRGPHPEIPLYTEEDARRTLPLFEPVEYGKPVSLEGGARAAFFGAGHILGSAAIRLELAGGRKADERGTIVFSGDIGQWDKPIIEDPTVFEAADYLVMESTYGDRDHEDPGGIDRLLAEAVNTTHRAGGNLLVPSFALERTQEVLYYLNELLEQDRIPHLMVFVDSPMAVSVTEVFKDHPELFDRQMRELMSRGRSPFAFPGLQMIRTVEQSKSINHIRGTAVIIAGSGMCTGGRIKHHLVHNISRKESTVLFVGYQAEGTLGRQILSGAREVRILGTRHRCRARILKISGFSAHAGRSGLLRWLGGLKRPPRKLFLTHGEPQATRALSDTIQKEKGFLLHTPRYGESVVLS